MNIFCLDEDPIKSAEMCCDKHIIKMILESAQLLSTAHRVLDGEKQKHPDKNTAQFVLNKHNDIIYKAGWINHPSTQWVMKNKYHYLWLYQHFIALNNEFIKRYHNNDINKSHTSYKKLKDILKNPPKNILDDKNLYTLPTPAMPEECLIFDENNKILIVASYRNYYIKKKHHFASWRYPAKKPDWYIISID